MGLIKICSSCQKNIIGDIGYITKALPGMLYLRMMLIEPDMTRHFERTKPDFLKPLLAKSQPDTWLTGPPAFQVSKEGHFLAGPRSLRHLGDFEKRGIYPNLIQVKSAGEVLALLTSLKRFLKAQFKIPYKNFLQIIT